MIICHYLKLVELGKSLYKHTFCAKFVLFHRDAPKSSKVKSEEEYSFLDPPPYDFFCPITYGLMLKPTQTKCCGKHISEEAVTQLMARHHQCPLCTQENFSCILDKHFQRQIQQLLIFCPNRNRGCGYMMEIASLDMHLKNCLMKNSPKTNLKECISMCFCSIMDYCYTIAGNEHLSSENATIIIDALFSAQKKSYELALALNINPLNKKPVEILKETVDKFLRQPVPTWISIVEALRSPGVKCDKLASIIETKFCSKPPVGPGEGI